MKKEAKFNVGDCVIHKQQGYRAVIIDIDPFFQPSGRINPQVFKREFATRNPWYRLLVDESNQMTYVEECLLIIDLSKNIIDNPQLRNYLYENQGNYRSNSCLH
ncbi:heat shock protein HspQ [Legionella hackeliae]|uniref:Heat shock protein HspQ n=1 Tax=Legionella hackeliae TaxID=449 RepID=A0A0A8UU01_LEGHA|nr:heat shock protein HspQ [Legionella hackeliae]KTD12760.1 putative DNA-binding protein hemimethylated [Legionella hackeliae]CEK12183.1 putative DNA-binding protein hemimethylated [Legionella hackeliae]STX48969.1 putative DNA-binding protein hemimethylated [Legionella hackeliae]